MQKIKALLPLNCSPTCMVLATAGGLLGLYVLRKITEKWRGSRMLKKYNEMRDQKLQEMKEGYEKLKHLHPRHYTPELIQQVSRSSISELQELLWDENSGIESVDLVAIFGQRAYVNGMKYGWLADQMFEEAYERAKQCDQERKQARAEGRKLSKIHGIPCSLKDHIKYKGASSHWGHYSKLLKKSDEMNLAVQCLMKDGAIPLLKSAAPTMPALTCDNIFSGEGKNPFNFERNAGGSSGGEAGLIGGNCIPFGIGSDQAGSLRVPASFCKVTTLCPGNDRIGLGGANRGLLTNQGKLSDGTIVSTIGPMCKTVDDCVSVMETLFSPQTLGRFSRTSQIPVDSQIVEKLKEKKLRIAYYTDMGFVKASPAVERVVLEAKKILEKKGHTLIEFKVPDVHGFSRALREGLFKDQVRTFVSSMQPYQPVTKAMEKMKTLSGWSRTKIKMIQFLLRKERETIYPKLTGKEIIENGIKQKDWKSLMQEKLTQIGADALLSPVLEICSVRLNDYRAGPSFIQSGLLNFMGMTGGAVPFGRVTEEDEKAEYVDYHNDSLTKGMKAAIRGSTGLPLSVQIASYPGRESLVLALMKQIEEEVRELNDYSPLI